jgi:predicted dehydrogenase
MIHYGIIGAGKIGLKRASCLRAGQLIGVHDSDRAQAEALVKATGHGRVIPDATALIRDPAISAIIVATRHDSLAAHTQEAVEAGKHVLVEKPAARDAKELQPVIAAAREAGVVVRVGYNHRFHSAILQARSILDSGALGALMMVRARYGHGGRVGYESEWRAQREISGGGELIDQGVHLIDLARIILGEFPEVRGSLARLFWDMPVEDNAFLELKTTAGRVAWLHASCSEWKNLFSLEIYGHHGKLQIDGLGGSYGPERLTHFKMKPEMGPPETEIFDFPDPDVSWARELAAFENDIVSGNQTGASLQDALAVLRITDCVYAENPLK